MNGNFNMNLSDINAGKWIVKIAAFGVYAAGGIFATLAFTQAIAGFFPGDPIMNALAHVGAWANLFSILLMVWAKDYWVTGRPMMVSAVIGWGLEVAMMALNTLAAFDSTWAGWWTSLSPATPVFVIALWGLLWLLHPDHRARQDAMRFYAESQKDFQDKLRRAMKTQRVQDIMTDGAAQAAQQYAEKSLGVVIDPTHRAHAPSGNGRAVYNADAEQTTAQLHTEQSGEAIAGNSDNSPHKRRAER